MDTKPIPFERYWAAVMDNPKGLKEGAMTYCSRIAELVAATKLPEPGRDMPEARLPYADR